MMLTSTLKKLISFRTVTGNNDVIKKALAWVKKELCSLPIFLQEHEYNEVPSLIITTREGQKNPKAWLAAHMDVVPGSERIWIPREENGRLIGRGSFDMKFAIACYIELFKELGQSIPQYDIGIMLTGDEENGGFNGTKKLVDEAGYRGEAVFLPDGGGAWQFEKSAKGVWILELIARGKSVHSSRPWNGESAIYAMSSLVTEIYALAQTFWLDTSDHWHLTCNVGTMNGGTAYNNVADEARVTVDIRFTSADEREDFKRYFSAIMAKYPNVSIREIYNEASYGVLRECKAIQTFADIAKERHGIECGWTNSHGSSDARHFAKYGIPSLLIWPIAGEAHSEEEWIDIADLHRFYDVMKEWAMEETRSDGVSMYGRANA